MSAGPIQARISPPSSVPPKSDFSAAAVDDPTDKVKGLDPTKTDFKALINNSMDQVKKERKAKENGDLSSETETEFLEKLADQTKEKRVPKNELGKDDFLKLFVTQLQNQDPLNPDDGTEMAAKLAQFNGLEQMMNVNKSLEKMLTAQDSSRSLQLVNYVGHEVTVDGGRVRLNGGVPTKSEFSIESPSAASTLEVRDGAGILVTQIDMGAMDAGSHELKWNGKTATGRSLPDGIYTYAVTARNVDGNDIPVAISAKARITGVDVKSENGGLYSDFGKIKFDQIRSVGRPDYDAEIPGGSTLAPAPLPGPPLAVLNAAAGAAPMGKMGASAMPGAPKGGPLTDDLERMRAEGKLQLGSGPNLDTAKALKSPPSPLPADMTSSEPSVSKPRPVSSEPKAAVSSRPSPSQSATPAPPSAS